MNSESRGLGFQITAQPHCRKCQIIWEQHLWSTGSGEATLAVTEQPWAIPGDPWHCLGWRTSQDQLSMESASQWTPVIPWWGHREGRSWGPREWGIEAVSTGHQHHCCLQGGEEPSAFWRGEGRVNPVLQLNLTCRKGQYELFPLAASHCALSFLRVFPIYFHVWVEASSEGARRWSLCPIGRAAL